MITGMEMYWLTRLDAICGLLLAMAVTSGIITVGIIVGHVPVLVECREEEMKMWFARFRKVLVVSIPIFVLAVMARIATPTTKEYAAIKVVPLILSNEVGEDAGELYRLGVEWAKDQFQVKAKE